MRGIARNVLSVGVASSAVSTGGRPPGRDLTALELRHLRLLVQMRDRGRAFTIEDEERLEDFVLQLRDEGCSARGIAEALEVGSSTVQGWTSNARRRRDET